MADGAFRLRETVAVNNRDSRRGWALVRDVCRGLACDVDAEIRRAYERYPFPYPLHVDYAAYTTEHARRTLEAFRQSNIQLLRSFGLTTDAIKDRIIWDLGAGVGWRAMGFAADGARAVHAFEVSAPAVELGHRFCRLLGIEAVTFHHLSLYELSPASEASRPDTIISTGTLHHVFDLRRVAEAIATCCRQGTAVYFTHSSYNSRLGLMKYYRNYLSWARGGLVLEERLRVGAAIWKRWIRATPPAIRINHVNDLAGVFYVARSKRTIHRVFGEACFEVTSLPSVSGLSQQLGELRQRLAAAASSSAKRRLASSLLIGVRGLERLPLPGIVDEALGRLIAWLFEMRPHYFCAIYHGRA